MISHRLQAMNGSVQAVAQRTPVISVQIAVVKNLPAVNGSAQSVMLKMKVSSALTAEQPDLNK